MNTYTRPLLVITTVLGILGLSLMASYTTYSACEFANTNTLYIKDQTLLAFEASEFKIVKYHAYKALTGIEKSKTNFKDCGCDIATESIDRTKTNLKNATKAPSIYDAKTFVHIALKNTHISINALENFKKKPKSFYGEDFLTKNTNQPMLIDNIIILEGNTLSDKIENAVTKFQSSLDKMIAVNDCSKALTYIEETYALSSKKLMNKTTSPGKRVYHKRIKEITFKAMEKLSDCK